MENNSSSAALSKILLGTGRYIFGLAIMISPLAILVANGQDPQIFIFGLLTPPITLVILPQILIGLYFMLTGKSKIRLDVTLILLGIVCDLGLISFIPGMNV